MVGKTPSSPFWSWALPIVWALILMTMSGDFGASPNTLPIFKWVLSTFTDLSPKTIESLHHWFRKSLHVICYGILAVLWLRALILTYPERQGANLILTLLLTLVVSLLDEGRQSLVRSRTGALRDVSLDMTGAILFTLAAARYLKRKVRLSSEAEESPFS